MHATSLKSVNSTHRQHGSHPRRLLASPFVPGKLDPVLASRPPLFTLGNAFLVGIMGLYGAYATGHLTVFDTYANDVVQSAHTHNDEIVAAIVQFWPYFAGLAAFLFVTMLILLRINHNRRAASESAEPIVLRTITVKVAKPKQVRCEEPDHTLPLHPHLVPIQRRRVTLPVSH